MKFGLLLSADGDYFKLCAGKRLQIPPRFEMPFLESFKAQAERPSEWGLGEDYMCSSSALVFSPSLSKNSCSSVHLCSPPAPTYLHVDLCSGGKGCSICLYSFLV